MYKQIIIARKDLGMSAGKLAAQVSHASMAFLTNMIRANCHMMGYLKGIAHRTCVLSFEEDMYNDWICGSFTKCILEAKNKSQLEKAITKAEELGLKEGKDFFLIKDNCWTELEPEEVDENGVGRTLTCIGFKPMDSSFIDQIGKKYQLWKG